MLTPERLTELRVEADQAIERGWETCSVPARELLALCGAVEEARAALDHFAPPFCPYCGPRTKIDEDGCCLHCGADTYLGEEAPGAEREGRDG